MAGCVTKPDDTGFRSCRLVMVFAVWIPVAATAPVTLAVPWQPAVPDEVENEDETRRLAQGIPSDRKTILALESFRRQVAAKQFESAIEELRKLRTADPESMVPASDDSDIFVPLYRAVFDSVLMLPATFRADFSESVTAAADDSFQVILQSGELDQLPGLILKFAGTPASVKAHLVAARLHVDRGHEQAARLWLTPILHRNVSARFRATAEQVLETLTAPNDGTAGAKNSQAAPEAKRKSLPRQFLWQYRPLASPQLRRQIDKFVAAARASSVVLQSSWSDEADDGVLYRKTMRGVAAVDLSSGKSLWEYPMSGSLDQTITSDTSNNAAFAAIPADLISEGSFARLDFSALASAFCRNEVLGSLSMDTQRVYALASFLPMPSTTGAVPGRFVSSAGRQKFQSTRLVALEKTTGRRIWTVGDGVIRDVLGSESPGLWIAGPPVVSRSDLYGVMEWNGEILLTCFASATGEVKWTKVLAFPEQAIDKDPYRWLRGARPMVDSGLIWCLTTTDRIVCVDELTQTVVWAGFLPSNTPKQSRYAGGRGGPVALTAASSILRRWSRSEIVRSGESLAVFSPQSHEIFLIDALTGLRRESVTVSASAAVVHADASHLVIGELSELYCLATDSGEKMWSCTIPGGTGAPAGRGTVSGGRLLVPLNSGAVLAVNLEDGAIEDTAENVVPGGAWGRLMTIRRAPEQNSTSEAPAGDLLYSAPERLIRISDKGPGAKPGNAVELASGLMASGQWERALQLAKQVSPADAAYREAERVRFNCLLQLAIQSPESWLQELREVSVTDDQKIQVRFLEVNSLLKSGNTADAAIRLVDVLKLNSTLATLPAPVARLSAKHEAVLSGPLPVTISLRSWAGAELSRLLEKLPDNSSVWKHLEDIPTTSLLSLSHPGVRPLLRQAAKTESSEETMLHLIRHSIDLARVSEFDDVAEEVALLAGLLQRQPGRTATTIESARSSLLNAVLLEFPEPVVRQLEHPDSEIRLPGRETLESDFRKRLTDHSKKWRPQPFDTVPVTRSSSSVSRNSVTLTAADGDDPFLRTFRWSAIRGEYGRLIARDIHDRGSQWSVPGTFNVYGNYSNRTDVLYRLGSVVLLRSFSSIAAVSVLDRTVLWSRDFRRRGVVTSAVLSDGSFQKFVAGQQVLPSERYYRYGSVRVAGTGHRWICLKYGDRVEVVDTLLGTTTWSMRLADTRSHVIATDDVVMILPASGDVLCVHRMTGQRIAIQNADQLVRRAMRNVGPLLVCWKNQQNNPTPSLEWVNPLTQKSVREVSLEKMTHFRFLNDGMLVGFNDQFEMAAADLLSSDVQMCSFRVSGRHTSSDREKTDAESSPPDSLPMWNPERIRVAADGLNFYLTNAPEKGVAPFRQPSGRELARFAGDIRTVDRATGNIRWWAASDGVPLASTDQPELPLLIIIEDLPVAANGVNPSYTRNLFRAVNKVSGDQLFGEVIPSKFGLRYLTLESPEPNVLDVAVYGNQVRVHGRTVGTDD